MELQQIKEIASKYINRAQGMLVIDGFLNPMIFAVSDNEKVTPVSLKIENDGDKDMIPELMTEMASVSEGLILILDSYTLEVEKSKMDQIPEDIKNSSDSKQALICIVHVKDASSIRRLLYDYKDGYSFFDLNWDNLESSYGRFKNPFNT